MFIIVAIAVGLLLFTAIQMACLPVEGMYELRRSEIIRNEMAAVIAAIDQRSQENPLGGYILPQDLVQLDDFKHLRLIVRDIPLFRYETVSDVNDGVWRFNRLALWFEAPKSYVGEVAYLSAENNMCGTGDFDEATSWCGRPQSIWGKLESKGNHSVLLLSEKQRIFRTMSKFYRRFNKDQSFLPTSTWDGQTVTLAELVGYADTAANCVGVHVYNEIPLTCDDLFNYWGDPITLNRVTARHIALVNRTRIVGAQGQIIRLAEEAILEKI